MAITADQIKWSNYIILNNGEMGRVGLYVENADQSLSSIELSTVNFDLSIWIQTNKPFISINHKVKINGEQIDSLPINITNDSNEPFLFYYKNISIKKNVKRQFLEYAINIEGLYYDTLNISTSDFIWKWGDNYLNINYQDYGIMVDALSFKKIILANFEGNEVKIKNKYLTMPVYIYSSDYLENENFYIEGKKLVKIKGYYNAEDRDKENDETNPLPSSQYIEFNLTEEKLKLVEEKEMYFYPVYENIEYKILYNGNGGTAIIDDNGDEKMVSEISLSFDDIAPEFTKNEYRQDGWSYSSSIFAEKIEDFSLIPKNQNITLYARWIKKEKTITVKYYIDENFLKEETFFNPDHIKISSEIPSYKDGYVFDKWLDLSSKDKENKIYYSLGQTIKSIKNLELTPVWIQNSYIASFYESSSTEEPKHLQDIEFNHNEGVVPEILSYAKWSYINNDKDKDLVANEALPNRNLNLYSVKETEVTIKYHYGKNNSKLTVKKSVYYNDSNILSKFKPLGAPEQAYVENNTRKYFYFWSLTENFKEGDPYYLPSCRYIFEIPESSEINFYAFYGDNENIESNIFIEDNNGKVSLVAENFIEDNELKKELSTEKFGEEIYPSISYSFFDGNSVSSTKFIELDNNIFNNSTDGSIVFNNFKQQQNLKRVSFLELSLKENENEDETNYIVLNFGEDDMADNKDDLILSL